MASDEDGFVTLDVNSDGQRGAQNVVKFALVRVTMYGPFVPLDWAVRLFYATLIRSHLFV